MPFIIALLLSSDCKSKIVIGEKPCGFVKAPFLQSKCQCKVLRHFITSSLSS